ncbi:MAG: DUF4831 family protein [Bacteroidales bacterium]|jgi:hypothetical protein|nr:DUF4831 family protein [Bacteroidales bacterium]MDD4394739.1 DUF4831 family protein [Bacteroidales bacterium]
MKRFALLSLIVLSSLFSFSQKNVVPLPADSGMATTGNYFYYALPKTAFKVDVVVNKTTQMKGYYGEYAEKLLGLTNIIKQNKTYFELKSVHIESIILPDENFQYAVELSNCQVKNGALAQIYAYRDSLSQQVTESSYTVQTTAIPDFFRYYSDLSYMDKENSYVETQIIDGVVRQVPATTTQKVTKTDEQKALQAADFIAKIRDDRYAILTGEQEVAYSKEAIEELVNQLNNLEKNYIQLFTGFTINDEIHYSWVVSPLDTSDLRLSLFSVSEKSGFSTCTKSAKDDENYYLNIKPQFSYQKCQDFAAERKSLKKYKDNNGYRIRQAVPCSVSIEQGKNTIFNSGIYSIYQFGKIETLPIRQDNWDICKYMIIF